jgi:hypothetical protein
MNERENTQLRQKKTRTHDYSKEETMSFNFMNNTGLFHSSWPSISILKKRILKKIEGEWI